MADQKKQKTGISVTTVGFLEQVLTPPQLSCQSTRKMVYLTLPKVWLLKVFVCWHPEELHV